MTCCRSAHRTDRVTGAAAMRVPGRDGAAGALRRGLDATGLVTRATALVWAGAFAYSLAVLYSVYRAGLFAFHDLGLINDFLANTVNHGRLFWVADYGLNLLGVHFSPSLILITPLYAVVDSQFLLLVIGTVAYYAALPLALRIFRILVPAAFEGTLGRVFAPCLVAFLALNVYARTVLVSAHFEVLFVLGALATLLALLTNVRLDRLIGLALLTAGVREDAGLHLVLPMLAVLFLPVPVERAARAQVRRKVAVLAAITVAYVLLVVSVVLPAFGPKHAGYVVQFWGAFGQSPREIAFAVATSPLRVLREIAASGFPSLNRAFGWIALLNPPVFLLTNLSGTIFYIAGEEAKKQLWYYNAGFLLAGMFLGLAAGLARLERLARAIVLAWPRVAALPRVFPTAVMAVLAFVTVSDLKRTVGGLEFRRYPPVDVTFLSEAIDRYLTPCEDVRSVASDFVNIVFFPNRYEKYMLINFAAADEVFLVKNASLMLRWGMSDAVLASAIRDNGAFDLVHDDARLAIYRKREISCPGG